MTQGQDRASGEKEINYNCRCQLPRERGHKRSRLSGLLPNASALGVVKLGMVDSE